MRTVAKLFIFQHMQIFCVVAALTVEEAQYRLAERYPANPEEWTLITSQTNAIAVFDGKGW